jgi:hypothetical protein
MKYRGIIGFLSLLVVAGAVGSIGRDSTPASAHQSTGAIFTTLFNGAEVNTNTFTSKDDVYLDGGPGPGAKATAAGLTDGSYVFQVTDPSGKKLLSTDNARCRQFTVSGGLIAGVVPAGGCEHQTGVDLDHGSAVIQLIPFLDTPNPGGVYKVWVTFLSDYTTTFGCSLDAVDCTAKGTFHGFGPAHSKTDNFKVKPPKGVREIDTRFFNDRDGDGHQGDTEEWLDGRQVTWTDTLGAGNVKSSYLNTAINVNHEAHVEAVEDGHHRITISNQPGCTVGLVHVDNVDMAVGPQTITVTLSPKDKDRTIFIDVACSGVQ